MFPASSSITENERKPLISNERLGPGEIDWHITLKGDAVVTATDGSGNRASVQCNVPPPPK